MRERKILFARILKNRKQKNWDWSGTINSLHKELSKSAEIIDLFYYWSPIDWLIKVLDKLGIKNYNSSISEIMRANKKYSKIIEKYDDIPILQFDEFPQISKQGNYIYQDLSVNYLLYIAKNDKELFKYSGFSHLSISALEERLNMQQKFYENCNKVFTMGQWLSNYLVENQYVDKCKIVHVGGGINIDKNKIDNSQKKGNKILFVGKDFKRKGGDLVIESFKYLQDHINSEVELYIIGPKQLNINLENYNINFLGELDSRELPLYYNLCDIFCMPSYFEAYGLVFIEALTYGLPCIGRDIFEMPYFIENNVTGYLIKDDNIKSLANKMQDLLTNNQIKANVISRRKQYLKEYSWETVSQRILENMFEN